MCPWLGTHVPSFGLQLWGLPSRVEYLSPQGVLLPLVYGRTASPFWLELRGLSAWQATPSWTVYRLACHRLLPWLWVTFAMVPDAAWPGSAQRVPPLLLARRVGWVAPVCPTHGPLALSCHSAALCVHVCAVSWATRLLFTAVPGPCVALLVRCPGPLGSFSPVCPLVVLCCVCGVLGDLAPVHRCAARCVVLRVPCPGPLGSCSPVCQLGVLCCVCGVLCHLAPVHWCARSVCCVACAVSWATWLLFTSVPAGCVVLCVRCPGPLGSCSPLCPLGVLCSLYGVLCHLALVR